MKILIATPLFPPDIGGPATYSKALSEELSKRGISVDVLSFGVVRGLPKIIRHLAYFWKVFWKSRKADLIFSQDPASVGFPACLAALLLRKRFALKIVGDYAWEQGMNRFGVKDLLDNFLEKKYGRPVEFLRRIEKFVAIRADIIIVPSRYLKSVVEKWGVDSKKINVIYNAVHIPEIFQSKEEIRKNLGLSGKILVSIGRLVPWKGFGMLIELMPEISKKYPDAKLLIIGSGPEEDELKAISYKPSSRTQAEGLKAGVKFLGGLSHELVLKYLKAADIFLLNTGYEGFSHQILEAMASGAPVISTPAGGNREILEDRKNTLVAAYNDRNVWLRAILELLSDQNLAQNLSKNARQGVLKFAGQNMIEETIKILQSL